MEPPFVRLLSPIIQGGYVLGGGAICMELLTKQVNIITKTLSQADCWQYTSWVLSLISPPDISLELLLGEHIIMTFHSDCFCVDDGIHFVMVVSVLV